MRKILFRGWATKDNKWVYGDLHQVGDTTLISDLDLDCITALVYPESIGQYVCTIGNTDVFEGDMYWNTHNEEWDTVVYNAETGAFVLADETCISNNLVSELDFDGEHTTAWEHNKK